MIPPTEPDPRQLGRGVPSVRDRLFAQRIVFLWGTLDHDAAGRLAAELMTLDATGDDPIHVHVDSTGGTIEAALSLMDVIDLLGVDLIATCIGQAVGPALGPLAVAHHRRATPHARFRLSEPTAQMAGRARDLESWASAQHAAHAQFTGRLAEAVRRPVAQVAADLASGRYLDAEAAAAYGLIDEICGPSARMYRLPGTALGFRPS